jgi:hypothetical protein
LRGARLDTGRGCSDDDLVHGRLVELARSDLALGTAEPTCWFTSLADAPTMVEAWRIDYNRARPHSALGRRIPSEFRQEQMVGS